MQIAVKEIHANPLQPRGKKPDVADLISSMSTVGLVQPLVVAKDGDGYVVIAGHRRLAAAAKLGWEEVECDVVDLTDPKMDIARIMAENEVRESLTGKERAAGLQVMIDLGWSDEDVQSTAGVCADEVAAAHMVSLAKKKTIDKLPDQVTLAEMAGLLEFESDIKAYDELMSYVGSDQFAHRISWWRQERDRKAKVDAAIAEIEASGVRRISEEATWAGRFVRLEDYRLKKGKLTPAKHAKCPGHCACIKYSGEIVYFCSTPAEHGLEVTSTQGARTDKDKALDKLKRQLRALWRASAPVRQEFIIGQLKVKPLNPALLDWAYAWAVNLGVDGFGTYKCKTKNYSASKDVRIIFVAMCVSAAETGLDQWVTGMGAIGDPGYRGLLIAYLKVLGKMRYPLSDHEKATIAGTKYVPEEPKQVAS